MIDNFDCEFACACFRSILRRGLAARINDSQELKKPMNWRRLSFPMCRVAISLPTAVKLVVLLVIPVLAGCHPQHEPEANLTPPESRPIYRVQVADGDEASLLRQQLNVEAVRLEGPNLFFVAKEDTLGKLREFGYVPQPVESRAVFYRVVKVPRKGREENLLKTGVIVLRREKPYWIVRGDLAQLESLRALKFKVLQLEEEPHPRQIEVVVERKEDVQRVAEFQVDIYSVVEQKEKGYTIFAGAFDHQIDSLRANKFDVKETP
jgi:hypothetical protein